MLFDLHLSKVPDMDKWNILVCLFIVILCCFSASHPNQYGDSPCLLFDTAGCFSPVCKVTSV